MYSRKIYGLLFAVCMLSLTAACGEQKTGDLSEKEMNQEHLELELMEKVTVDAEITPYDKYKAGLSSYYIESYYEGEEASGIDVESYMATPVIFRRDIEKVKGLIEENSNGRFTDQEIEIGENGTLHVTALYSDTKEKWINCWLGIEDDGRVTGTQFWFQVADGNESNEETYAGKIMLVYYPEYDRTSLSFADADETGEMLRDLLETLTGSEYAEKYECIPVSKENYQALKETGNAGLEGSLAEEYYTYIFYHQVDGFRWKYLNLSIEMTEDIVLSEDVASKVINGYLFPSDEWTQVVAYGAEGIRSLQLDAYVVPTEIYKEQEQVADVSEVLKQVEAYFDTILVASPITIYSMEICYSSWFSDAADGPLESIVSPMWVVQYWDGNSMKQLLFDAYTGKFLMETPAFP